MRKLEIGEIIVIFFAITALYYPVILDLLLHLTEPVIYGESFAISVVFGIILTAFILHFQKG